MQRNQGNEGTDILAVVAEEMGLESEDILAMVADEMGPESKDVPALVVEEIIVDLSAPLFQSTEHFFVNADAEDLELVKEVGELDPHCNPPQCITSFLTLSTITKKPNCRRRNVDPVVDLSN